MNNEIKTIIALSASMINRAKLNVEIATIDLDALYKLAAFHQMTALISEALEEIGIKDPRFKQEKAKAVRKIIVLDNDRSAVLAAMEEANIWYLPLKGVILKDYYPRADLRQMSDNDILFDATRAYDVKAIMESLGFTTVHFGTGHQDDYQKPPVSHFEMHRMLFSLNSDERLYRYYRDVKARLIKSSDNECGYQFTNEDFYIYMIAHEYKHYSWGGTGIRSLLDTYVFLQRFQDSLDWEYITRECSKLNIKDFEEKNRELAITVFTTGTVETLSEDQEKMLAYFFGSGAYGTREHSISNRVKRSGKLRYVWRRVFPPIKAIKKQYPFFFQHKVLLPIFPIYRVIKRWEIAKQEIKIIGKTQVELHPKC